MRVALIGSGGREHAIAYKISESDKLKTLYCLPGNPGTAQFGQNIELKTNNEILKFCKDNEINLVIVGPEQPLVEGICDLLRENNILAFGPSKSAAQIEGDKTFSKLLMKK